MLKKKLIEEKYNVEHNHKHNIDNYKKKIRLFLHKNLSQTL